MVRKLENKPDPDAVATVLTLKTLKVASQLMRSWGHIDYYSERKHSRKTQGSKLA